MSAAKLLDRLEAVKQTGTGQWQARCPAHEDRGPSLSIKQVDDCVLIHCFAGCECHEVIGALGLTMGDLFDKPLTHSTGPASRQRRHFANARETLKAIAVPIKALQIAVEIQQQRPLTDSETIDFREASAIVNQAMAKAAQDGLLLRHDAPELRAAA